MPRDNAMYHLSEVTNLREHDFDLLRAKNQPNYSLFGHKGVINDSECDDSICTTAHGGKRSSSVSFMSESVQAWTGLKFPIDYEQLD